MHRPFTLCVLAALIPGAWVNEVSAQDSASHGDRYRERGTTDDEPYADSEPPTGNWIRDEEYGLIWVPSRALFGASPVPEASRGSWRRTSVGWMLASDWHWGWVWAALHCGPVWWRECARTGRACARSEWHCRARA